MEPKKYEYIDSLRGIAILLVIIVHTGILFHFGFFPNRMYEFIYNGRFGVQLFFIVSAFTLTISYHNRINEIHQTRNFFLRRFFRIAPIFYIAILASCIELLAGFNYFGRIPFELTYSEVLTNLLFINGFFPEYLRGVVPGGWTIAIEFAFYMILPFLCRKIKNINTSILFLIAALVVSSAFSFFLKFHLSPENADFRYYNVVNQLPIFALGILAYWILNKGDEKIRPSTLLSVYLVVLLYCYLTIPEHFLYSLGFFILLLTLSIKPYKLFSNKILARIGKVSFSMYLIHFVVIGLLSKKLPLFFETTNFASALLDYICLFTITLISTYLFSELTYRFIEIPGQNLGRKLIKKLNQPTE